MDGALSLERHGFLDRYNAPIEAAYREWLGLRIRPLGAMMSAASLLGWIALPVLLNLALPSQHDVAALYLVCWGINVPLLTVCLIYLRRSQTQLRYVALGTAATTVTGIDSLFLIGPAADLDAAAYLAIATLWGMIAPLVFLPFRITVAIGVGMAAAGASRAAAVDTGAWGVNLTVMAGVMVVGTLVLGPAMAFASERWLRTGFADEQTIAHQRQLIRRYAPSSVVSRIEHGDTSVDHPQRRKVTVFFSDVVGFTALADRVDPEALAEIVNDYLGALSEVIERHGGTLNEFAGDGVMAIFGAPDDLGPAEQVLAALAAAHELQGSLPEWSRDWYQHGIIDNAQARVGINTGTVSVGTFGSAVRATYTGIGLQTNIAARVQAQAEPGGILLSNTSWHLVKDVVDCAPRGEVTVKGVHFPIELYEPL